MDPIDAAARRGWLTAEQARALREEALRTGRLPLDVLRESGLTGPEQIETVLASGVPSFPAETEARLPLLPERYEYLDVLGEGGMGMVLRVRDRVLKREVALKMIRTRRAAEAARERFLVEAQTTAQLAHPGIVPVYDVGTTPDGDLYVTMKVVEGQTLRRILPRLVGTARGRAQLLRILIDVAQGLAYAHERGVVHRDLKPENVMIGAFGETLVMDWGLARVRQEAVAAESDAVEIDSTDRTVAGQVMGTLRYMSPEQYEADPSRIDHRTDLWALGVILYEGLSGRPPFEGATALELGTAILERRPRDPRSIESSTPPELAAIVLRCLAKDPEERYPGALALAEEFERFLEDRSVLALPDPWTRRAAKFVRRNPVPSGAAAVLALVVAIGGAWLWRAYRNANEELEGRRQAEAERDVARLREEEVRAAQRLIEEVRRWAAGRGMDQESAVRARYEEVAAMAPDRAFPRRELGDWYFAHRFPGTGCAPLTTAEVVERARTEWLRALDLEPDDVASLANLSMAFDSLGSDGRVPMLEKIIAVAPDSDFAAMSRGFLHLRSFTLAGGVRADRVLQEALQAFDLAIEKNPGLGLAYAGRAAARALLQDEEGSIADLIQAFELGVRDPHNLCNLSELYLSLKRSAYALAEADRAISLVPDHARAHLLRGRALLDLGHAADALASLDRSLALDADRVDTWIARSQALWNAGDAGAALRGADAAVARFPSDPDVLASRGYMHRQLARRERARGRDAQAEDHLRAGAADLGLAIEQGCTKKAAIVRWAEMRAELGDASGALDDARRLAARAGGLPELWYELALALRARDRTREAVEALGESIGLASPGSRAPLLALRGQFRMNLDDREGALDDLTASLEHDPGRAEVRRNRALLLLSTRRPAEALTDAERVVAADPGDAVARSIQGEALYALERWREAAAAFDRFLELAPEHAAAARARRLRDDALARAGG